MIIPGQTCLECGGITWWDSEYKEPVVCENCWDRAINMVERLKARIWDKEHRAQRQAQQNAYRAKHRQRLAADQRAKRISDSLIPGEAEKKRQKENEYRKRVRRLKRETVHI